MAQYEAVFSDGLVATFEADSLSSDDGVVLLKRNTGGKEETVVAIGSGDLLFIRDVTVNVELADDEWAEGDED